MKHSDNVFIGTDKIKQAILGINDKLEKILEIIKPKEVITPEKAEEEVKDEEKRREVSNRNTSKKTKKNKK